MKTIIVMMMIIVLMVCGVVMADGIVVSEDPLVRAGKNALSYYEEQLKTADDEIFVYMNEEISSDRVIASKEMVELKKRIKSLSNLKKEAVEHLKTYELILNPDLDARIEIKKQIISQYFGYIIRDRDIDSKVRMLFAQAIGQDLNIEGRFDWTIFAYLLVGFILGLTIFVISMNEEFNKTAFVSCIGMAICFIILLIGLLGA